MVTNFSSVAELNALNDATRRVIDDRSLRQHVVRVHVGGPTLGVQPNATGDLLREGNHTSGCCLGPSGVITLPAWGPTFNTGPIKPWVVERLA